MLKDKISSELFFIQDVAEIGSHEGYRVYDNKVSFGTQIGPVHSIEEGLLHEIAHVVEVQDLSRLKVNNFGLEIKNKVEFLGRVYFEPITWNATKLECRVILWQEVLCEIFGLSFNREKFATSLQYMPDFLCIPIQPVEGMTLKEKDALRFQIINQYMTEQKNTGSYTYEEFRKKWDIAFESLE